MRRFATAFSAVALALSMALGSSQPAAAVFGYDSAYQFESAFLTLNPGDSGTFSVFFANTGTTSWLKGTASQVNLATCLDDKVTCNVAPEEAAFASSWLSATAYATHTKDTVIPGDFSAFTYNIKVPAGQAAATYRFNGDLVLSSSSAKIHPEGYFQDAKVAGAVATSGITVSPDFPGANIKANYVSTTVPGVGQHTVTFNAPAGTVLSFAIIGSSNVARAADGTYSFLDCDQNSKANFWAVAGTCGATTTSISSTVQFTAVNGVAITPAATLINQTVPASGTITVTIDSPRRDASVRVIGWEDKNANGQVDLVGPGDVNGDFYPNYLPAEGLIAVSGTKLWTGPNGTFGAVNPDANGVAQCTTRRSGSSVLSIVDTGTVSSKVATDGNSLRYTGDDNDIYRIAGTPVSKATFFAQLGSGDTVAINFNPDPAGVSEFNICSNAGADAPSDLSAAVGNFDSGTTGEDVRLTFTTPSTNSITTYPIQRSPFASGTTATAANCTNGATAPTLTPSTTPADSTFVTVGNATQPAGETATFTNFDLANGGYCFRVRTQNTTTGVFSYSNYVPVNIPGTADVVAPTSTLMDLSTSSGFANTLDTGDEFFIEFTEAMSIAANATIRFTDSDCGAATNGGPATCTGGTTNTVGDVVCGTNATCTLSDNKRELVVKMTGNPTIIAAGSTAGLQFPIVVTDASGVTDLSGNAWNLAASTDRLIP